MKSPVFDSYLRKGALRPTLLTVYLPRRHRTILAIVCVLVALMALGLYRSHIRRAARNAVFRVLVERLKSDASDQLRIGVDKAQAVRFFSEHHMQVDFHLGEASGSLQTTGCAPFGCSKDTALIQVHVSVDSQGTVTDHPRVIGMYTDCF